MAARGREKEAAAKKSRCPGYGNGLIFFARRGFLEGYGSSEGMGAGLPAIG
jgi:hypothetical protein